MDLSPAEEKLWACAERGEIADFRTNIERSRGHYWQPSVHEGREWGSNRTVRAEVIHSLWMLGHPVRVDGCVVEGKIFTAETAEISFSAERTIFTERASFNGATFTEPVSFAGATFTRTATFAAATFTKGAWFEAATFAGRAWFDEATFSEESSFSRATFTRTARFDEATFSEESSFSGATFTRTASFIGATFTGAAGFTDVWVRELDLTQAGISGGTEVSTEGLHALTLNLSRAVIDPAVHLELSATTIIGHRTRIARYSQLRMRCGSADFTDADLGEHCLLAALRYAPAPGASMEMTDPSPTDSGAQAKSSRLAVRAHREPAVKAKITKLRNCLESIPTEAALLSLERAVVAGVTVSGLDLTRCQFHGAHGLDELRIDPGCTFASSRDALVTPASWLRPRLHTRRRIIADETLVPGLKRLAPAPSERDPDAQPAEARTPGEVAETYRALRKSLEDAKNQPGASDFYYGEMQMRRRAHDRGLTEHVLVTAYWIVSGYGLRAGRALAVLVALIAIATAVFMHEPWATVTKSYYPADQPSAFEVRPKLGPERDLTGTGTVTIQEPDKRSLTFSEAAQFSLRESVALIRPASDNRFRPRGVGVVADIALRILGPLLIALALLAIRARTKR
ncbi:pentapeptide repeat-containing protein [Mycobacteroides chelonae]|uniref:pentapeptide repeat-containing protein n=1 Tax=Mycobacteroides chelonae TaxID=1774 RepID=UPI0008A9E26D|nr:pentapeptide repeat-containing protein [Mycobacteroides chelonae]OHU15947.1 hypothetical protein BKG75_12955 [Mycobacteroides chelonae]